MTVRERSWEILSYAGSLIRRGSRRGAHEAQVRKLEWEVDRRKAAIGKAVYPLIETGALQVDLPEVQEELTRIRELHDRLRELHERRLAEKSDERE